MDWLARKLYPNARPYERRSKMEVVYVLTIVILVALAAVVGVLALIYKRPTH